MKWNLHFGESSSSFFGHFSHRSEWQLIKIDYKGLFSRRCMDGDYQTWHLHNKVTAILNIIDLLSASWDACMSAVSVNTVHSLNVWPRVFLSVLFSLSLFRVSFSCVKKRRSSFSLSDRESCVWWGRSRSLWSAGQATVACWLRTTPGSIPQSHASAQPMILNGNDFFSQLSQLGLNCNWDFYPQWYFLSFITCLQNSPSPLNI